MSATAASALASRWACNLGLASEDITSPSHADGFREGPLCPIRAQSGISAQTSWETFLFPPGALHKPRAAMMLTELEMEGPDPVTLSILDLTIPEA